MDLHLPRNRYPQTDRKKESGECVSPGRPNHPCRDRGSNARPLCAPRHRSPWRMRRWLVTRQDALASQRVPWVEASRHASGCLHASPLAPWRRWAGRRDTCATPSHLWWRAAPRRSPSRIQWPCATRYDGGGTRPPDADVFWAMGLCGCSASACVETRGCAPSMSILCRVLDLNARSGLLGSLGDSGRLVWG